MRKWVTRVLPLVAAFLVGSVVMMFASAEPTKCDWSQSGVADIFRSGTGGSGTPEEALKRIEFHSDISLPAESVRSTTGDNRFAKVGTDSEGNVAFNVYLDGVDRIHAEVMKLQDGTYALTDYTTCYGV